jgi:hypothetical protein
MVRMRLEPHSRITEGELGLEKSAHRIRKPNFILAAPALGDRTITVRDVIILDVPVETPRHQI